jgi:aspartate kinase
MKTEGQKTAKFGGTSLADANRISKVVEIVKSDPSRRFVVVSAPGKRHAEDQKVTDMFAHWARADEEEKNALLEIIYARFKSIVDELEVGIDLDALFEKIEQEAHPLRRNEHRLLHFALSRGEWLCGKIVAAALGFEFLDAAEFITFDSRGTYDPEATTKRAKRIKLQEKARKGVVIPGFYGHVAGSKGMIQTFPRGGSDITGAIVAALVEASVYENWTDVLGIRMADPRVVKNPKKIPLMTYRELRELTFMGANVFHENAVAPVRAVGIPIHVRSTSAPSKTGTWIVTEISKPKLPVTGIAGKGGFTTVTLLKYDMNNEVGFLWRALGVFQKLGIGVDHCPGTVDSVSFVVATATLEGKQERLIELLNSACNPDVIRMSNKLGLVCTVGIGMAETPGIAGDICSALGKAGINITLLNQGGSEINIVVGVKEEDLAPAIRAIYNAFVS